MTCLLTHQENFDNAFKLVSLESKDFENEQKMFVCERNILWRKHFVK